MKSDGAVATSGNPPPWYRQRWPWFLIALPATAVIGSMISAVLAVRTSDGSVAADYYKQGLAINQEVARAQLAQVLGLEAQVALAGLADGDRVRVEVRSQRAQPAESAVELRLVHPGRSGEDRVATLQKIETDPDQTRTVYAGTLNAPHSALPGVAIAWQVALESTRWRIDDSFTTRQGGEFRMRAR
ncbi:MAG TPA: FixH family protein [Burkholderiaceae bacterium]|nr:FixH family protein [Burkholderiaceae bacterium]